MRNAKSLEVELLENRRMFSVVEPNNTLSTAVIIDSPGGFGGVMTVSDAISPSDPVDYYKINAPVQIEQSFVARLSGLTGDLNLTLIHDLNGDGIETPNEVSVISSKPGTADETVTRNLITVLGTYYLKVAAANPGVTSNYTLDLSNDTAPDTTNRARTLFANGGASVFDALGNGDLYDVYKIQFNGRSNTATFATRLTAANPNNYHVDLYMDANRNGTLDPGEMITSSRPNNVGQEIAARELSAANTYYLRVLNSVPGNAQNYLLHTQMDYAGNTPATAQFMGGPEGRIVSWLDQVGDELTTSFNDSADFFKFVVSNPGFTAVSQVNLPDTFFTGTSLLRQELYQDKNKNNQIDAGELIGSAQTSSSSATSLIKAATVPGIYFVKITGSPTPNYEFNFSLDGVKGITSANPNFSNSRDLGTLTRDVSWDDGLGAGDASDTYKFKMPANGSVNFRLQEQFSQEQSPIEASLAFDANGNGKRDAGETIALFDLKNPLAKSLKAGTYYVTLAGGMHYAVQLRMIPDFAGNNANTAKNLGTLTTFASATDVLEPALNGVSSGDVDFYKFKLNSAQKFTANLVGYDNLANVTATVFADNNGALTQVKQVKGAPGGKALLQTDLPAGNYQVSFSVTGIILPYTTGFSAGDNDDSILEANVNPGNQLFSNGSKDFTITDKTDVDMIRFLTAPGHRIAVDVDARNGSKLNSYLRLFDAKGNQLASNDDGTAPGETTSKFSYLTYRMPAGSAQYVYVYAAVSSASNKNYNATTGDGDSGGGSTGDYRVTLTDLSGGVASLAASSPFSAALVGGEGAMNETLFG